MFRHNLILILRNFRRYKSTLLINLIGLSSGLACTLLIYLWATDEWKMDKFHTEGDRLYRVMVNNPVSDLIETSPSTQAILGEALLQEVPEIEREVTTLSSIDITISIETRHILRKGILAEPDFFKVFTFDVIKGSSDQVLTDVKSIVISESTAKALFASNDDAIGKVITWSFPYGKAEATITGVFKDVSNESSMQFDYVMPFQVYKNIVGQESLHWGNFGCNTFILARPNTDVAAVNAKLFNFLKKKSKDTKMTIFLAPFADYYLYGTYRNGKVSGGRIEYVRLFSLIGGFIIVLACINFMNLSTAKATRRIKEVGVKKAIGAGRSTLIVQYLSESLLMTFVSLIVAVLLADLLLPAFNVITGKHMTMHFGPEFLATMLGIVVVTGLIAGSYPALYLSAFSPARVLKGSIKTQLTSATELFARKGLIVFQFVVSLMFIMAVWVVYKQIDFVQTLNLGYDKDQLISIKPGGKASDNLEAYISEIKKIPGVVNASSISRTIVGAESSTAGYFNWEGKDPDAIIRFEIVNGNYDLIETLGVQIKEGRSFSRDHATDSSTIIFNEAAIAAMGLKDPIGRKFNLWGKDLTIIGVTKDFHFESLHETVKPLFFRLIPGEAANQVLVKFEAGREKETLASLEAFSKQFNPGFDFSYQFVDSEYEAQYNAEKRVSALAQYFAGLAIIISCLGLFGLAAFTAERRLKEIGIRKVLGAGEWRIVWMLSADFIMIVLIASCIALPLSYIFAARWLSGFAFRIQLAWWYFPLAGMLAMLIALLTVGVQAFKASMVNPAQCLKEE